MPDTIARSRSLPSAAFGWRRSRARLLTAPPDAGKGGSERVPVAEAGPYPGRDRGRRDERHVLRVARAGEDAAIATRSLRARGDQEPRLAPGQSRLHPVAPHRDRDGPRRRSLLLHLLD